MTRSTDITGSLHIVSPDKERRACDPLRPAQSAALAIALLNQGDPLHPAQSAALAIALKLPG